MQQNNQEFALNGVQLINSNLINYIPNDGQQRRNLQQQPFLYCSIPNLLLNQQGVVINQPNVLLNQSTFALNQQPNSLNTLNQIYSNNQLLQTANQQSYLANLYGGLNVIAPTNLITSPFINSPINQSTQKINKKTNSKTKKTKKTNKQLTNKKKSKKKAIEEVRFIDEETSDEDNEINQLNFREEYNNFNEFDQQLNANTDDESDIEQSINEDNDFEMRDDLRLDDNLRQDLSTDEDNDDDDEIETANEDEKIEENSNQMLIDIITKPKRELNKKIKQSLESLDTETRRQVEEIQRFAKEFKNFRKLNDITQNTVSKEISDSKTPISQSKLCRFEQYAIDPISLVTKGKIKSAFETKALIETYLEEKKNPEKFVDYMEMKIRKKRTNYPPKIVDILTNFFNQKTHPSNDDLIQLSRETNYKPEDIKVWFNNKRQSLKKSFNYTKNGSETSSELN